MPYLPGGLGGPPPCSNLVYIDDNHALHTAKSKATCTVYGDVYICTIVYAAANQKARPSHRYVSPHFVHTCTYIRTYAATNLSVVREKVVPAASGQGEGPHGHQVSLRRYGRLNGRGRGRRGGRRRRRARGGGDAAVGPHHDQGLRVAARKQNGKRRGSIIIQYNISLGVSCV